MSDSPNVRTCRADSESAGEAAFFVSVYNVMLFVAFSSVRSLAL